MFLIKLLILKWCYAIQNRSLLFNSGANGSAFTQLKIDFDKLSMVKFVRALHAQMNYRKLIFAVKLSNKLFSAN